jgi:hypothetical protein
MSSLAFLDVPRDLVLNPLISLGAAGLGLIGVSVTIWRDRAFLRRAGLQLVMMAPIILGAAWPHLAGMGFASEHRTTPDIFGRTEIFYPDVQDLALPALLSLVIAAVIAWRRPADRAFAPWAGLLAYGVVAAETLQSACEVGVYW